MLTQAYTPVEGYTLPEGSYWSIPEELKHLPIRPRKNYYSNWQWVCDVNPDIDTYLMSKYNRVLGIKPNGALLEGMPMNGGGNWPIDAPVPHADIEVKRVQYYTVLCTIHTIADLEQPDVLKQTGSTPFAIIDDLEDVLFYVGKEAKNVN